MGFYIEGNFRKRDRSTELQGSGQEGWQWAEVPWAGLIIKQLHYFIHHAPFIFI